MIDCTIYVGRATKQELVLRSPLLAAAGALGFAPDRALFALDRLGALITPPISWHRTPLASGPRLARTHAGYLSHTGRANPGLRTVIRRHESAWRQLGVPVIAALYVRTEDQLLAMAALLAESPAAAALELHLPHDLSADRAQEYVMATRTEIGVPCLVRLPFARAKELALAVEEAGADALVVADPPLGRVLNEDDEWVYGPLHSPALVPLYVQQVQEAAESTNIPIIARGGLSTLRDILSVLAAGAAAVQLDSILWRQPSILETLYRELEAETERRDTTKWSDLLAYLGPERHPATH